MQILVFLIFYMVIFRLLFMQDIQLQGPSSLTKDLILPLVDLAETKLLQYTEF